MQIRISVDIAVQLQDFLCAQNLGVVFGYKGIVNIKSKFYVSRELYG